MHKSLKKISDSIRKFRIIIIRIIIIIRNHNHMTELPIVYSSWYYPGLCWGCVDGVEPPPPLSSSLWSLLLLLQSQSSGLPTNTSLLLLLLLYLPASCDKPSQLYANLSPACTHWIILSSSFSASSECFPTVWQLQSKVIEDFMSFSLHCSQSV